VVDGGEEDGRGLGRQLDPQSVAPQPREVVRQPAARLVDLGRGFAWLDTGTHESLLEAGEYVRVLENRQGIRIACVEEIAMRMGFIDADACFELGARQGKSGYGTYVTDVAKAFDGIRGGHAAEAPLSGPPHA